MIKSIFKKFPFKSIMVVGWLLAAFFWWLSLSVTNERVSNLVSEAFGASVSIVAFYTLALIIIAIKKLFTR